jgi:hypothetical protein
MDRLTVAYDLYSALSTFEYSKEKKKEKKEREHTVEKAFRHILFLVCSLALSVFFDNYEQVILPPLLILLLRVVDHCRTTARQSKMP